MEKQITQKHILFDLTTLDAESEEIEEKTRRCYQNLKFMINNKSPKERQEIYSKHIAANPQLHTEELTMGLLVAILYEQQDEIGLIQNDYYRDVVTISKDNLNLFTSYLNMIIIERITRLSHYSLKQIFWVASQLLKAGANTAENTCSNLVRQTAKSDLSARNLFMAENLIDLLCDNRSWLVNSTQFMGPTVIYNLMRLIADHVGPAYKALRRKETDFVVGLIREKFDYVMAIGKDFLRMLHYLTRIPEFQNLHQDIYMNDPKLLHPKYEGPQHLMSFRTPRRLFQSCLTFDMERKISFLATQVKFGNQRRYQEWFAKHYFSGGTESTLLRCDLIRYICTIIHPSNEVLCSDIIPRWAIIGWLLTTANHVVSNCRLALFFDWFAFDPKTDNIMNIEPGILVMCHSVRQHPQVTASLLEFLCRAPTMFPSKISEQVKNGIKRSLQQTLEKRVLQSLTPVFHHPKYDPALKVLIKESFPEYFQSDNGISYPNTPKQLQPPQPPQHPTVITAVPTLPQPTPVLSIQPTPAPSVITSPATLSIQDEPKKPDTSTSSEKTLEMAPTDEASSVIQSSDANSRTKNMSAPDVEHKTDHQDSHHNARTAADLSGPPNNLKVDPVVKKQRQPVTKMAPKTGGNLEAEKEDKSPIDDKRPFIFRKGSMSLGDEHSESNDSQSEFSTLSGSEINHSSGKHFEGSNFFSNLSHFNMESSSIENTNSSSTKVIYPFMTIREPAPRDSLKRLDETIAHAIDCFNRAGSDDQDACSSRRVPLLVLIHSINELDDQSVTDEMYDDIAGCLAQSIADDFTTRIFPPPSEDWSQSLIESISTPLFIICKNAFPDTTTDEKCLRLLVSLTKFFEATSFLVLYYMRVRFTIRSLDSAKQYVTYCEACKREPAKSLIEDLQMMCTYDSEMFCFMLPVLFSEYAVCDGLFITNNIKLIRLVVSAVDPKTLHEMLCYCLTGTLRIISREDPLKVIEASLAWESWEQYCFWKIVSSQSVPIENYVSILPKLDSKSHPEALSSIIMILQRFDEPSINLIQHVVDAYSDTNEHFVGSTIRYWAIKTDVKKLASNILSLFNRPSSPQLKRKGQVAKSTGKSNTSGNLSTRDLKLLRILEYIRQKAPRNKLLAQAELFETLAEVEQMCDEKQKKRFSDLFALRAKPAKKKRLDKDSTT